MIFRFFKNISIAMDGIGAITMKNELAIYPFLILSHTALEMLEGSSAENEIEFKCGICSKKCRVPQDRAVPGKIAYFKSSKCKLFILV